MMSFRSRVLTRLFGLLYGPLVFLHEPAGSSLFGPSWAGRRAELAQYVPSSGVALDLGCGSGRLLEALRARKGPVIGIDLSLATLKRARGKGESVVRADAACLPLSDGSVHAVVCSYPGAWIRDSQVWDELARVTVPGAPITILLGGTVTRGRFSVFRSLLGRLVYGRQAFELHDMSIEGMGHERMQGNPIVRDDAWGEALVWIGTRLGN